MPFSKNAFRRDSCIMNKSNSCLTSCISFRLFHHLHMRIQFFLFAKVPNRKYGSTSYSSVSANKRWPIVTNFLSGFFRLIRYEAAAKTKIAEHNNSPLFLPDFSGLSTALLYKPVLFIFFRIAYQYRLDCSIQTLLRDESSSSISFKFSSLIFISPKSMS